LAAVEWTAMSLAAVENTVTGSAAVEWTAMSLAAVE